MPHVNCGQTKHWRRKYRLFSVLLTGTKKSAWK